LLSESTARAPGSKWDGSLALLDDGGRVLAEARDADDGPDPLLMVSIPRDGTYTLRVSDLEYGGSAAHFYRIRAGAIPYAAALFPLGVAIGQSSQGRPIGPNLRISSVRPRAVPPRVEPAPPPPRAHR